MNPNIQKVIVHPIRDQDVHREIFDYVPVLKNLTVEDDIIMEKAEVAIRELYQLTLGIRQQMYQNGELRRPEELPMENIYFSPKHKTHILVLSEKSD